MDTVPCLRVSQHHAQQFRRLLQSNKCLDLNLRLLKDSANTVLLPILPSCLSQVDLPSLRTMVSSESVCEIVWRQPPLQSKKRSGQAPFHKLEQMLQELVENGGEGWTEELRRDLPHSFQRHGDLILLGDNCFTLPQWNTFDGDLLWASVAKATGAKRLAKMSRISKDGFRSPIVTMLLGEHSWVTHVDNGIRYEFDVTKCMFSAGNITEKLRVSQFDCRGETVVDLYAGIGYFTLPYLVHAKARHVHACEWNPDALRALQKNLVTNRVSERCTIHPGDNRELHLNDIADRVNLGLIPSSEDGWPVACRLLKRTTGGFLHIHQNVTSSVPNTAAVPEDNDVTLRGKTADREAWQAWAHDTANRISCILGGITGAQWMVHIKHIEHVKSYAPHVHHIVLDLECRPRNDHPA
ncbi:tRNA wybutosine-synthesizing protein 2 homolog [Takifugu rubripes]|uniref:tRNA wybutosine-synthesizing protein 2 homolog n=1 Tax=Takifugu rubripes TaxID=31033 RepID=A0A3B5KDJ7_TAKRU|nr:tRNA wybutosine-synthesizing protein 2 homolog [Takifugu rubripes]|eukprot:XP_003970200.1 PREDICTED: tRNA wybutosine-synthesizing protein 2 homolog isoform X1 [Takifugu rubripes]